MIKGSPTIQAFGSLSPKHQQIEYAVGGRSETPPKCWDSQKSKTQNCILTTEEAKPWSCWWLTHMALE